MLLNSNPKEKKEWAKKKLQEIYEEFSSIDKYTGEDEKKFLMR